MLRIWLLNKRYIVWLSVSQRLSRGLYNSSEFEDEFEFEFEDDSLVALQRGIPRISNRNLSKTVPALEFCSFRDSQKVSLWSASFGGLIPPDTFSFSSDESY